MTHLKIVPAARNSQGIKVHPLAALLPLLRDDEMAELVEDIRTNGLRSPLVRMPDGVLIDDVIASKPAGVPASNRGSLRSTAIRLPTFCRLMPRDGT